MKTFLIPAVMALAVLIPGVGAAQSTAGPGVAMAEATREDLTRLLEQLEQAATAPDSAASAQQQALLEAESVRERLEHGDFHAGDRVALAVTGEPALSDTFAVNSARAIVLPQIGSISLEGVLRSELEPHLTGELNRYINQPAVRASVLIRIAVLGAVGRQGFYMMPANTLLEEALMTAGGPSGRADIRKVSIERGERVYLRHDAVQQALIDGRSLDQLNLQAGDRIIVPERRAGFFDGGVVRTLLVTVPSVVLLIMRLRRM